MKEMFLQPARVFANATVAEGIFSMTLAAPDIAKNARAGQFVMLYLNRGELLLPRPISICDAHVNAGTLELVYQVVGDGTHALSQMKPGERLQILGALGNGFDIEPDKPLRRVAVVGGGIGVPPLYFLAKTLRNAGVKVDIFLGFRSMPILMEKFCSFADSLYVATEDGSFGQRGYVTDILQNWEYDGVFSCGPLPLLRAVSDFCAAENLPCQVSMEERMACGLGTCVGCVVKVGDTYARVCTEGPVFSSGEVNFHV